MKRYEWAVVGGGIAGIAISEILTREGHSVVLIDKNEKLAGETTRDFHEWIHTGALYTLVPDRSFTLRFILGAIDDLLEFYSSFDRMNLQPGVVGLSLDNRPDGWFDSNYIHFHYRVAGRKWSFPWLMGVARSMFLIDKIAEHDWLRRRAGELNPFTLNNIPLVMSKFRELARHKEKFYELKTPDFTTRSRNLLRDLVTTAIKNGLDVSLANQVQGMEVTGSRKHIIGERESFTVDNVAICAGKAVKNFVSAKVKISYAPIAVVEGVSPETKSFVELDYFPKNCINMLTKDNGIGLVGGISLSKREQCEEYLDFVIARHKVLNPGLTVSSRYIGLKNEITFAKQPRNYLYHIIQWNSGVWSVIPGKFTLGFSLAPEFYRQAYERNPAKFAKTHHDDGEYSGLVADTVWADVTGAGKSHKQKTQESDVIHIVDSESHHLSTKVN